MSKYDAERAFKIYKTFSKQTDQVVQFLSVARQYENATRLEIPKLKHAPTSLTSSLEEYLNDPDFEINRRQYLAQQEAKKGGNPVPKTPSKSTTGTQKQVPSRDFPEPKPAAVQRQEPNGPAPDLIDFFDSIEQNQQPMATQPQNGPQYPQQPQSSNFLPSTQSTFAQNGLPQQQPQQQGGFNVNSNPYDQAQSQVQQQVRPGFTGAGFDGLSQQQSFSQSQNQYNPVQQNTAPQAFPPQQQQQPPFSTIQPPQQPTNPFRQVSMLTGPSTLTFTSSPAVSSPLNRQGTNPFARNNPPTTVSQNQNLPLGSPPPQQPSTSFPQQTPQTFQQQVPQPFTQQTQPIRPHRTGTNPFARTLSPPTSQTSTPPPLMPNVTGSTNPFRQSTFMNQQTGQGWQSSQATMGGLEQLETVPVFPRPGQPQQYQQQQPSWP
ncbi:MAG: hypothetical protein Q9166_004328 [cf. Caloplaca sp. 2 TL-2023]